MLLGQHEVVNVTLFVRCEESVLATERMALLIREREVQSLITMERMNGMDEGRILLLTGELGDVAELRRLICLRLEQLGELMEFVIEMELLELPENFDGGLSIEEELSLLRQRNEERGNAIPNLSIDWGVE